MSLMPTIISYYTRNTGYQKEIVHLERSIQTLGLDYQIVGIESRGSWENNCCYKPLFILEKLREIKKPILWLDADAILQQKPSLLENLQADVALFIRPHLPQDHPSKIASGTLYFRPTLAAEKLLLQWHEECQKLLTQEETVWDQIGLKNAFYVSEVCSFSLPETYCAIFDKTQITRQDIVILHYQASRLLRKEINREVVCFWQDHMLTQKEREVFSTDY